MPKATVKASAPGKRTAGKKSTEHPQVKSRTIVMKSTGASEGPPPLDSAAVSRVVPRVEISTVELLSASFSRPDEGPLPDQVRHGTPEMGVSVAWELNDGVLGCRIDFGTVFRDRDDAPFEIFAAYRVIYILAPGDPPIPQDINQFAHWNAVFNVWPYWRELVGNLLARAGMPAFMVPVVRVPVLRREDE